MDVARAPHNAQTKLKAVMTPIWTRAMGHRLRVARERQLRTQGELATILSVPGSPISKQTVAKVESGRLRYMRVTWARLEAALGRHTGYVLIARDEALYNEALIGQRYHDARWRALRRRFGLDPKKGEAPPWPKHPTSEERAQMDVLDARQFGPRIVPGRRGEGARRVRPRGRRV
jgi:hypothetical protein